MNENENLIAYLQFMADEFNEQVWSRVERGREKIRKNPDDDRMIDYWQGVIHGMDNITQQIYERIENLKKEA